MSCAKRGTTQSKDPKNAGPGNGVSGSSPSQPGVPRIVQIPPHVYACACGYGVLRLRNRRASRSRSSAQDDSFIGPGLTVQQTPLALPRFRRGPLNPCHPERSCPARSAGQRSRRTPSKQVPVMAVQGVLPAGQGLPASCKFPSRFLIARAGMRSFDSVTAALRAAVTPLRMTVLLVLD